MARKAEPFRCFIDVDAPEFTPAGNIPERIKEYCKKQDSMFPKMTARLCAVSMRALR